MHALEIQPRTVNPIHPGDWLRLQFDVSEFSESDRARLDQANLEVPRGWTVLIPPYFVGQPKKLGRITAAVEIDHSATAGRQTLILQVGNRNIHFDVEVIATRVVEWAQTANSLADEINWWVDQPLWIDLEIGLVGNVATKLVFTADLPSHLSLEFHPKSLELQPGRAKKVRALVTALEDGSLHSGAKWPIRLQARLSGSNKILSEHTVRVHVLKDSSVVFDQEEIPIQGYAMLRGSRLSQNTHRSTAALSWDWGVWGHHGYVDQPRGQWRFAWHSQPHRGRRIDWANENSHWVVGQTVFGSKGLSFRPRLGRGISVAWSPLGQTPMTDTDFEMGYQRFVSDGFRYDNPWLEYGPWQLSWTRRSLLSGGEAASDWPSLGYVWQNSVNRVGSQFLRTHLSRYRDRWSASLAYGYRLNDNHHFRLRAQSVPTAHPSQLAVGQWLEFSHLMEVATYFHALSGTVQQQLNSKIWETSIRWSGWSQISEPKNLWVGVRANFAESPMQRMLELSARSNSHDYHWMAAVNQNGQARLRASYQLTNSLKGLLHYQTNDWRVGLQGNASDDSQWGLGILESHFLDDSGLRLYFDWQRSKRRQGAWSMSLDHDLRTDDWRIGLRYQWRWSVPLPAKRPKSQSSIRGRVMRLDGSVLQPVSGAWLEIGKRVTRSDEAGQYRFESLPAGNYEVHLNLPNSEPNWLFTSGSPMTVALGPMKRLTLDWTLVRAGQLKGQVSGVDDPKMLNAVMPIELVGQCEQCALTHRYRVARVDEQGQFRVKQLMPGQWTWRIKASTLPPHREWAESVLMIEVSPGQSATLNWSLMDRALPTQWQVIDI